MNLLLQQILDLRSKKKTKPDISLEIQEIASEALQATSGKNQPRIQRTGKDPLQQTHATMIKRNQINQYNNARYQSALESMQSPPHQSRNAPAGQLRGSPACSIGKAKEKEKAFEDAFSFSSFSRQDFGKRTGDAYMSDQASERSYPICPVRCH